MRSITACASLRPQLRCTRLLRATLTSMARWRRFLALSSAYGCAVATAHSATVARRAAAALTYCAALRKGGRGSVQRPCKVGMVGSDGVLRYFLCVLPERMRAFGRCAFGRSPSAVSGGVLAAVTVHSHSGIAACDATAVNSECATSAALSAGGLGYSGGRARLHPCQPPTLTK